MVHGRIVKILRVTLQLVSIHVDVIVFHEATAVAVGHSGLSWLVEVVRGVGRALPGGVG